MSITPHGRTVCIKIGGAAADAPGFYDELARSVCSLLDALECFPVIVHGGGKAIARMLDSMNKTFSFVEGMRVTDAETLRMVQMVLSGDVNKSIVNALVTAGVDAAGVSGVDCGLMTAGKMLVKGGDIGFVGDVKSVNTRLIDLLRSGRVIPVVSPISRDAAGTVYNVNADVAATVVAETLRADDFLFISDVKGVMVGGAVRRKIMVSETEELIAQGHITGGMVPKVRAAAQAVGRGVGRVHICGWSGPQTLLRELSADASGTVIAAG